MNQALATKILDKSTRAENPFFQPTDSYLSAVFRNSSSPDPSMHSLGYIRMTSRKGLSCYRGEYSDILFSLHPNDDQRYIIYPPNEQKGYHDVKALADILKKSGKALEIIRIPEHLSSFAASTVGGERSLDTDLDYIYPVHIIDTSSLSEMRGTKYLKFRNKVNAANKEKTTVRETTFSNKDINSIRTIVSQWAPDLFGDDFEDNVSYIDFVLDEMLTYPNIKGLISEKNGIPNGFTIWEEPVHGYDTANSLIHSCLHERGLSELLHHEMAKTLYLSGIDKLSLGGAETRGLDAFKRKMQPSASIKLETLVIPG